VVPAKRRFDTGDIVCERNAALVPLYVVARDKRGRLTVVDAEGAETVIGAHFVDDYIEKVCATERQLLAQRSALAALLKATPSDDCSVHARAHAALAPSPAPPPAQKSVRRDQGPLRISLPPPPRKTGARGKKSTQTSSARFLFDLLGILEAPHKTTETADQADPRSKHRPTKG
jgi:hypothetical protein